MFNELVFRPIFNLLLFLYSVVGDFGIAVVIFTIVVKILLYPLLKSQTLQTKKLQEIQPELKKIKQKTKGNKQLEYLMTMSLYKQNEIKMSASLLNLIIQLPIIIAMFSVVRVIITDANAVSELGYEFIKNMAPIQDLITNHSSFQPMLFGVINLGVIPFNFDAGISSIVTLLFVAGAAWTQYYMVSSSSVASNPNNRRIRDILAEAGEGKEPDQAEINGIMIGKMNKIMPIMIFVSFGMLYGAIGFYQLISGIMSIIQRKIILDRYPSKELKPVDNTAVEERLKRAKTAEILLKQRTKKAQFKKTKSSKPTYSTKITRKKLD